MQKGDSSHDLLEPSNFQILGRRSIQKEGKFLIYSMLLLHQFCGCQSFYLEETEQTTSKIYSMLQNGPWGFSASLIFRSGNSNISNFHVSGSFLNSGSKLREFGVDKDNWQYKEERSFDVFVKPMIPSIIDNLVECG